MPSCSSAHPIGRSVISAHFSIQTYPCKQPALRVQVTWLSPLFSCIGDLWYSSRRSPRVHAVMLRYLTGDPVRIPCPGGALEDAIVMHEISSTPSSFECFYHPHSRRRHRRPLRRVSFIVDHSASLSLLDWPADAAAP